MYCPECGTDAAEANFCAECGNDLTSLGGGAQRAGICPECGSDAGKAKFCPECGHQMPKPMRQARGQGQAARAQRPRAARRAAERQAPQAPSKKQSKTPVALIWGGFAVVAIIVVIIVAVSGGGGGGQPAAGSEAVSVDTSGSYSELVSRGNDLYDTGIEAFNKNDSTTGEENFRAAAAVYKAAWAKQPGDPNVGTDMAVSLFYSRHHDEAIQQIAAVLKGTPDFQPAHLNKGIFLKTEAQESKDSGKAEKAAKFLAQAKLAFQEAVSIDAKSESGQRAAELLKSL
jgi:hypothetical protein